VCASFFATRTRDVLVVVISIELWVFGRELGSSGQGQESVNDSSHAAAGRLLTQELGRSRLNLFRAVPSTVSELWIRFFDSMKVARNCDQDYS
jgi:hypothetical protein